MILVQYMYVGSYMLLAYTGDNMLGCLCVCVRMCVYACVRARARGPGSTTCFPILNSHIYFYTHWPTWHMTPYNAPNNNNNSIFLLQIIIHNDEDLLLLDNSNPHIWKIRNCRGEEGYVPALCVLIPGPYQTAIDKAVK